MTEGYNIKVCPGRIAGTIQELRNGPELQPHWDVPLWGPEEIGRFVRILAEDPLLAGRWSGGQMTEEDQGRIGFDETGWSASCGCGMRQPCRHAQSILFQFRQETRRNPWLWLEAFGGDAAAVRQDVQRRRSQTVRSEAAKPDNIEAIDRAKARAARQAGRHGIPWALRYEKEPDFWNRDVSFADWLRPVMAAFRRKEE